MDEQSCYGRALKDLAQRDARWRLNWKKWVMWGDGARAQWISHVKSSATEHLPMAVELVTEATKQRLWQ